MLSKETASTERLTDRSKVQLSPTYAKVEEVNLHSSYDEPGPESYLREVLAAEAFIHAGVPAPAAKHVVLRQNGNFHGGVRRPRVTRLFDRSTDRLTGKKNTLSRGTRVLDVCGRT